MLVCSQVLGACEGCTLWVEVMLGKWLMEMAQMLRRVPWLMRTDIPPLLQYPVGDAAFPFVCGLIRMFYGLSLRDNLAGLVMVARCFLCGGGGTAELKKSE
jgi:hypothetical protein